MANVLEIVNERGTKQFRVDITTIAGAAIAPTAFKWHLTDRDEATVNGLVDQVEALATSIIITLSGADLLILDPTSDMEFRTLTVETDRGDASLPETLQSEFWVRNLHKISN